MICCALIACKKVEVVFTYSPTDPRAGQTVTFVNNSSSGEEWGWSFGDGATSVVKSPSHVFKQPGTYRVTLKVDNNNAWVATKEIKVYDTIPSFSISDSVFSLYRDYTLTVLVYNPYNYTVDYLWTPGEGVELADKEASLTSDKLVVYFTHPGDSAEISLRVRLNGTETNITRRFFVADKKTNAILMRTPDGDYRQRIFGARAEAAQLTTDTMALHEETDTVQTYNNEEFTLSELAVYIPGIQGFHIANRKLYYRADGLWVANIRGTDRVQIDSRECNAMTLDTHDNRIYWANSEGVWYMPFIGSDNNKFVTVPVLLNAMNNVTKIAADAELK